MYGVRKYAKPIVEEKDKEEDDACEDTELDAGANLRRCAMSVCLTASWENAIRVQQRTILLVILPEAARTHE